MTRVGMPVRLPSGSSNPSESGQDPYSSDKVGFLNYDYDGRKQKLDSQLRR